MIISLIAIGAVYSVYNISLKSYRREGSSLDIRLESTVGLEVLRQDVEHAGYGIGIDESQPPLQVFFQSSSTTLCTTPSVHLVIRSTYRVSRKETQGWALLKCLKNNSPSCYPSAFYNFPFCEGKDTRAVLLHSQDETIFEGEVDLKTYKCKDTADLLAFPIAGKGEWLKCDNSTESSCSNQFCNVIEYYLDKSSSAQSDHCRGTYVLKRKVDSKEEPFLDCVGDFKVVYDWGGTICDPTGTDSDLSACPAGDIRQNLNMVYIFLLLREGREDPNFTFKLSNPDGTINVDVDKGAVIKLKLPKDLDYYKNHDPLHFRWKIVKLVLRPLNLNKSL